MKAKKSLYNVQIVLEGNQPVILENEHIISCYFIEDIFKNCMMGKLIFNDVYGFFELGPFTGNEQIIITYGVEVDKNIIFDIWKVGKITQSDVSDPALTNIMEMEFVDPTFASYTLRRYSKSWVDTKISDIMVYLVQNMLNLKNTNLNVEESKNKIDNFIIPYWNVLRTMKFLSRRGCGIKSNNSGYLVYNNTENNGFTTNIKTLNYLFNDLDKSIEENEYLFECENIDYENKILDWWINSLDKNSLKGLCGGVWKGYDINEKKFLNQSYTYKEGISETVLLGKKSLFNDIDDLRSSNTMLGEKNLEDLKYILYNDWIKKYSKQNIVNIILEGHEKRYAGKQIEIIWPSVSKSEKFNKGFGGNYLISSITHYFKNNYRQRIVLLKNAYDNLDSNNLVSAVKTNMYNKKRTLGNA